MGTPLSGVRDFTAPFGYVLVAATALLFARAVWIAWCTTRAAFLRGADEEDTNGGTPPPPTRCSAQGQGIFCPANHHHSVLVHRRFLSALCALSLGSAAFVCTQELAPSFSYGPPPLAVALLLASTDLLLLAALAPAAGDADTELLLGRVMKALLLCTSGAALAAAAFADAAVGAAVTLVAAAVSVAVPELIPPLRRLLRSRGTSRAPRIMVLVLSAILSEFWWRTITEDGRGTTTASFIPGGASAAADAAAATFIIIFFVTGWSMVPLLARMTEDGRASGYDAAALAAARDAGDELARMGDDGWIMDPVSLAFAAVTAEGKWRLWITQVGTLRSGRHATGALLNLLVATILTRVYGLPGGAPPWYDSCLWVCWGIAFVWLGLCRILLHSVVHSRVKPSVCRVVHYFFSAIGPVCSALPLMAIQPGLGSAPFVMVSFFDSYTEANAWVLTYRAHRCAPRWCPRALAMPC